MTIESTPDWPFERQPIRLSAAERPMLMVVVDTEEEFDWHGEFDRNAIGVTAMQRVDRAQSLFEEFGICPTYVADYPIASQESAYRPLRELAQDGKAIIGAHLHPWVNPPFEEEVSRRHSFPCNLPIPLEERKLRVLTDKLEESFGFRPTVYKAGRYGIGSRSPAILEQQGFEVDLSANPPFDFSSEGGPDFSEFDADPYWFGCHRRLLGIPTTGAYTGLLRALGDRAHDLLDRSWLRALKVPAVLSRAHLLDRLHLSPEGYSFSDLRTLTASLLARGSRCFVFSFHSPSLKVGCTPYVTNRTELGRFLDRFRRYFDYFSTQVGGVMTTPLELHSKFRSHSGDTNP